MVRKTIHLTAEQVAELKKLAKQKDVSAAELVGQAVNTVIRLEGVTDLEERRRRALSVIGRFSSEPPTPLVVRGFSPAGFNLAAGGPKGPHYRSLV